MFKNLYSVNCSQVVNTWILSWGTPKPIMFITPVMYCDLMCSIQLATLKMASASLASCVLATYDSK